MPSGFSWLDQLVKQNSLLLQLQDRPPKTLAGLRRRVKRDKILLADLLKSEGFYAGSIETTQNRGSRIGRAIKVDIKPGPLFKYKSYGVEFDKNVSQLEQERIFSVAKQKFKKGDRAKAKGILETEQEILTSLSNIGFPFAKISDRVVTVDHADASVSTNLKLSLGPRSTYGSTFFEGLGSSNAAFLLERMEITKGDAYSQQELDEAKKRLLNTGLFTNVNIRKPKTASDYGAVPIIVEVRERERRQVSISAGASLQNGPTAAVEWRHRDLFGRAQNLIVKLEGDSNKAQTSATLEWPDFRQNNQILSMGLSGEYDGTENLENTTLSADVTVGRWYDKKRTFISVGSKVEYIRETGTTDIWLASLPVTVDFNRTDSLLNSGKGFRVFAELAPYVDLDNTNQTFLKSEIGASSYTPILDDKKLTLSTWAKVGAIIGEDLADIPTSKRFFIGGSGSVRAFEAKGISANGFTGALGKIEGGLELRTRVNNTIGAVAFIEGGNVFDSLQPDLKSNWKAGAGLGFRYFTSFGPVRVDLAIPVSQKADFNDVQIQVGLGQAF